MTRPMTCPTITTRMPKWNSGLPIRSSRLSYSCDERVVQPNLSYRYRHHRPTTRIAIVTYGTIDQNSARRSSSPPAVPAQGESGPGRQGERVQPDRLGRRPLHGQRRASRRSSRSAGAASRTRLHRGRVGGPASAARPAAGRSACGAASRPYPASSSTVAANSSTTARWSGNSRRGRHPGRPVDVGELQQRHAPIPGVAGRVVGQEQGAPAAPVERLDILAAASIGAGRAEPHA